MAEGEAEVALSPSGPEEMGGVVKERGEPLLSLQGGPGDGDRHGGSWREVLTSTTKGRRVDIGHGLSNTAVAGAEPARAERIGAWAAI